MLFASLVGTRELRRKQSANESLKTQLHVKHESDTDARIYISFMGSGEGKKAK